MKPSTRLLALLLVLAAIPAHAEKDSPPATQDSPAEWELAATAYWNKPRGEDSYVSGIFAADHDALHLEARSNYEAVDSQSVFVGWTFTGGETLKYKATPLLGSVSGDKRGPIAGLEATLYYGRWDYYIEAEYVHDLDDHKASYVYAWTELGYRPVEWLRAGIAAQRTRVYGEGRDIQRGGFAQVTFDMWTLGAYWFSPGASDQVSIVSLGLAF